MPEGPEVTAMVDELSKIFKNSSLKEISIHHNKFKSKLKDLKKFEEDLPLKIKEIKNKGKFVYIVLAKDLALGFTPGMTGHFWVPGVSEDFKTYEGYTYNSKHNYIFLKTTKGDFYFNDPRRFGHFYIYNNKDLKNNLETKLKTLGPDLIKQLPKMSQAEFNERLSKFRPNKNIADALLEQKFIAGVGNYIRAEALYKAKISPLRTIGSLNANDKKRLKNALKAIGEESYKSQKKKLHTFKIYGNPSKKQTKRKGRTIWWDPKVQM
jgi:DNA-formamidopyrimidine glycosylase